MAPTQNARIKTAFVNTVLANAFATVTCTHATPSRVHSQPLDVPHFIGFSSARNAGQCRTYCKNAVRFVPEGCIWKTVSLTKVAARTSRACATGACGTPALLPCCYWNSLALTGAAASKGQAHFATRKPRSYRTRLRLRNILSVRWAALRRIVKRTREVAGCICAAVVFKLLARA